MAENSPQRNPIEAARRGTRPALRRRFYGKVAVEQAGAGYVVLLTDDVADPAAGRLLDRPVHTPAHRILLAPALPLAQAIAMEWQAQRETIDPATMPLTRLANAIVDGVAERPQAVAGEVLKYLGSDLLFYRAEGPPGLVERQQRHWDPILDWAVATLGARFRLTAGITHVGQPDEALRAARAAIPDEPWRLGAVHAVTTLTGSALIALAAAHGVLSVQAAWQAANVDEDWNMEQWGRDELALRHRAFRFAELQVAALVLSP